MLGSLGSRFFGERDYRSGEFGLYWLVRRQAEVFQAAQDSKVKAGPYQHRRSES